MPRYLFNVPLKSFINLSVRQASFLIKHQISKICSSRAKDRNLSMLFTELFMSPALIAHLFCTLDINVSTQFYCRRRKR